MSRDSKSVRSVKSEIIAAMEYEERKNKADLIFTNKVSSCFKCSKANPTEIILDQTKLRQYEDDRIQAVHDLKYNCSLLQNKGKEYILNCRLGNKSSPEKCSTCKHAKNALTVRYINLNVSKTNVIEKRTVYKCTKHNEKGHYYRSTYKCDQYKEK